MSGIDMTKLRRFAIISLCAASLSACTTINPYTNETQTSKAVIGAGTGALAGAAIGLIVGNDSRDRRQKALIGAGIGGLSGGAVGYYMDVQEAKLRQKLSGTGVDVVRDGDNLVLNMPSSITFDVGRSDINSGFYSTLDSVASVVQEHDKTLIEIQGHTDSTGSAQFNQTLSEKRAASVSNYFSSRNINNLRLATYGHGENYPIATNDTESGRQANRRVEIVLVPIES